MRYLKASLVVCIVAIAMYYFWKEYSYYGASPELKGQAVYLQKLETEGAPNFTLPRLNELPYELHRTEASLVIVNFWATWCAPCVTEYPAMLKMVEHFEGQIKLIAVSVDEEKKDLLSFLNIYGKGSKNVIHLWDPKRTATQGYGTTKLPETFIFDSNFKLIRKVPGQEEWDAPFALEYLEQLIEERSP